MSTFRLFGLPRAVRLFFFAMAALVGALGVALPPSGAQTPEGDGRAIMLDLEGAVTPASADYLVRGMRSAAEEGAALVVIRMDTPGGLDASMRQIIREILASPVPVASWVAPSGSRAASAGTYILYASHVAAMAPGTNLGAATPVAIGGGGGLPFGGSGEEEEETAPAGEANGGEADAAGEGEPAEAPRRFEPQTASEAKVINDAVAYIRGLADLRGRNAEWAERAVREAVSLGAREAAEQNVIDFVAPSLEALLDGADGMVVQVGDADVTLATAGLEVEERGMGLRTQILQVLTDPNVAILLMVFGFYGIVFEIINPGTLIPGTIGAISLLTGFYALSVLPVNIAGAGLMLLGVGLLVAEAFAPSFGVLGIGGAIALTLGATLLIDTDVPGFAVSWPIVAAIGVASFGFAILIARLAQTSHRRKIETGREEMIGSEATVVEWRGREGAVWAHGERWRARSDESLSAGDVVEIRRLDGLTVVVGSRQIAPPEAAEARRMD